MEKPILSALLAALILLPAQVSAAPPNLCDEPVLNSSGLPYMDVTGLTISRWCEPHVEPPAWNAAVCCVVTDEANCVATVNGRCRTGMMFWCDHGERIGDGVACYQHAPDLCDMGSCSEIYNPDGMEVFEGTVWSCCEELANGLSCTFAEMTDVGDVPSESSEESCGGFLAACVWGVTNPDGTISCFD